MKHGSIIITGASSGIGRAVAQALSNWDGLLVLSGRSQRRLEETLNSVTSAGGHGIIIRADLSEPAELESLVASAEAQAALQGVIHCGGEGKFAPASEQPPAVWAEQINLNLVAAYNLTHLALKVMAPRKSGHLIYINSIAGRQTFPASSAYVAAKHGLRGLADSVREEARSQGIRVTSIYPGATATPWWEQQEGDFPLQQMLSAEHVAQAVAFAFNMPEPAVVEELVVRHLAGDF